MVTKFRLRSAPQIAGHHDLQELARTYYQVFRARTKVQHSLINHCLPLYFPEMHRYWCTTRNEWFVRFLLELLVEYRFLLNPVSCAPLVIAEDSEP
ncbi:hypothetical protein G3O00_36050 [Burkholderia sp. Ac-20384]|uniref:hypothetical protein n=1 Tax=Burkholderia sp. Ac-20384 TaxID=2703902 RepID=UPI00197DA141|nr:hypothetical protein [Burkholderia sp. Ac-20384]MBN3828978.1 hypothetical protein [Burkholderia sp. Ac-20384]